MQYWKPKKGPAILIKDMSRTHLENVIKMLYAKYADNLAKSNLSDCTRLKESIDRFNIALSKRPIYDTIPEEYTGELPDLFDDIITNPFGESNE